VELAGTYDLSPEKFNELLKANGLKAIATHFDYNRWRENPDAAAAEAKALGLQYAGCAWIPHQGDFDEKTCRDAIAVFNKAGEACAKQGMKFFYHTHGYEFQPYKDGTLFDLLLSETNPKLVTYEMDVLWIVHPGQDPIKLLNKYSDRFELMHIKDLKKGVKGDLTGGTDVRNDVALGTGQIELPAVLRTAKRVGVKWYFIEDESPTVTQQLPLSLKYLEQVRW
jgi:sugar phosphate isomerase/epimerase